MRLSRPPGSCRRIPRYHPQPNQIISVSQHHSEPNSASIPSRRHLYAVLNRHRQEYARILNTSGIKLDPSHFAASPVVVMLDGTNYVRSIQSANPDGSLTFYCAIEEGLVFRVAKGVNLMENLNHALEEIISAIGPPQAMLVFDCILRKLEISQLNLRSEVAALLCRHRAVGFNTYGEQYQGVHVNQTLVGIAFGEAAACPAKP